MKKAITLAALIALFNPISATALQIEVEVQGITRTDERREWTAHVARVQQRLRVRHRLRARWMSRVAEAEPQWEEPQEATAEIPVPLGNIPKIIYSIFGGYGAKAVAVASCESGLNPSAVNGQYFGLFQMGSMERAIYGGSSLDPADQTRAAYAYFLASGSDWSPWSMGKCA